MTSSDWDSGLQGLKGEQQDLPWPWRIAAGRHWMLMGRCTAQTGSAELAGQSIAPARSNRWDRDLDSACRYTELVYSRVNTASSKQAAAGEAQQLCAGPLGDAGAAGSHLMGKSVLASDGEPRRSSLWQCPLPAPRLPNFSSPLSTISSK